jgi:hypothetical protein
MEPLIVSSKAARRLRLLLGQGAQLPPALQAAAAAAGTYALEAISPVALASPGGDGSLGAALLPEPAPLPAASGLTSSQQQPSGGSRGWQGERDVLCEVAVTVPTLQALRVRA